VFENYDDDDMMMHGEAKGGSPPWLAQQQPGWRAMQNTVGKTRKIGTQDFHLDPYHHFFYEITQ